VVTGTKKFERGLSRLLHAELHWLDVPERVMYKLSVMMYSCLHGQAPQYLLDACQPVSDIASRRHIRSAGRRLLNIPRQRRSIFARRAFSVAGSLVWNSLRDYLRDPAVSRDTFCKHLKTLLFECIRVFTMMRYINLRFLWSPYGIGQTIIFSSCGFFLSSFFARLISAVADWMSAILPHMM